MRADARYAVLAVLGLCVIAALAFSFSGPLIYSLEKDVFPSRFHDNTDVLKIQAVNSTTDVLPLMPDLLDYTGPIVVNIRIQDVEQARRDLELFTKSRGSLNNLIIKLDMSESEMQEFSKSKDLQQQLLTGLLNSSISLDALENLEIQYRDQNRPDMLMSVQYQGDAIRKKVREIYAQYRSESAKVVATSTKYGLDITEEEESVWEFDRYVRQIDAAQDQLEEKNRIIDFPIRRSSQLSLLIYPETGRYGDTINCFGYYFSLIGFRVAGTPDKQITLYLDDAPVGTVMTDKLGSYTVNVPIAKVPAGSHTLHAESGTTQSDLRTLTILSVDSATTLAVSPSKKPGEVICTGTVIANQPVRNAPVELVWDGTHVNRTTTNAKGEFEAPLSLPNGKHTVVARFTGEGYPIHPSESKVQEAEVSVIRTILPADYGFILYIGVFGVFLLFIGGAVYYLRRMEGRTMFGTLWSSARTGMPAETGSDATAGDGDGAGVERSPDIPLSDSSPSQEDSLVSRYAGILQSAGLSAAAYAVYRDLAGRIAYDLQIPRHTVLTPREMSRSCKARPYCGAFSTLVSAYERIRYGGYRSVSVQAEFETTMHTTDSQLEGGHH
jgi:hypothetical protein